MAAEVPGMGLLGFILLAGGACGFLARYISRWTG